VLPRYERIAFEKSLVAPQGQPARRLVCPGHPLLDAVIDLTLERNRDLLKRGAVLVDDRDLGTSPRVLFYLEHAIQDASLTRDGNRRVVSKRMLYVELDAGGVTSPHPLCPLPGLPTAEEPSPSIDSLLARPECQWIEQGAGGQGPGLRIAHVVPEHLAEVKGRKLELLGKTEAAVKDRLAKEISYWDHRAEELKLQESAGKTNARMNANEARKRADNLQAGCRSAWRSSSWRRSSRPLPPVVLGGLLVVPRGAAAPDDRRPNRLPPSPRGHPGQRGARPCHHYGSRAPLGFEPTDRELDKLGYDIESRDPAPASCASSRSREGSAGRTDHHRHPQRDPLLTEQA
jgi:hypothetical protein